MLTKDLFHRLSPTARILFIRLRSMGDCLLLTSPIRALKQQFPAFRIAVLVEPQFAGCFDGNPDFDEILLARKKYATAARLLRRRFDAIVNLHGGPTSLLYACMAWGRRIGLEHYQYAKLYNGLMPRPDSGVHTVESTTNLLQWLGLQCEEPPPLRYEFHAKESARIKERLRGRPYVVIHPASVMATKRWEACRFAEVGQALSEDGLTMVVTAGPGEGSLALQVAKAIQSTVVLLDLSIRELAE